jgi:nucleoside-diphosphate-sugar epimerase
MAAVGKRKLAAVVGATGFVGSHIVKRLLASGYGVNCASRNPERAQWLKGLSEDGGDEVAIHRLVLTPNGPQDPGALDALVKNCSSVFFAAGFETQAPETIDFMVNNCLACIDAASRNGVGAVVVTSSGGSTNPPGHKNETPKRELEHWSDHESQIAKGKYSPAAKTLMELRALEAVGRDRSNVVVDKELASASCRLVIMNPNLILGPQLQPGPGVSGNSLPWMSRIIKGETMNAQIPNDSMSIIHVEDLAALHVAASEREDAAGRYFGVDRSYPWSEILAAIKKAHPAYVMPPMYEGEAAVPTQFDHTRKESLGVYIYNIHVNANI